MKRLFLLALLFVGIAAEAQQTVTAPSVGESPTVLAATGIKNATAGINPASRVILSAAATSGGSPTLLQLDAVIYCTAVSSGTVQLQFNYTDIGGSAQTVSGSAVSCATLGANSTGYLLLPVMIQAGTPIYGGVILSGTATYTVGLVIMQEVL